MIKNYFALTSLILLISVSSCKKEQQIPSYLHIQKINASGIYSISGSDSSNIFGAKVFLNNNLVGVYQTPVDVPLFAEGDQNIKTIALVEKNGIFNDLIEYPFYNLSENTVFLSTENTAKINPVVSYSPSSIVEYWFEDFENPSIKFITTATSSSTMVKTSESDEVYEGNSSGIFQLDNDSAYIKTITNQGFVYKSNSNAFVEVRYKNNQPFFFDVITINQSGIVNKIPFFQFKESIDDDGNLIWKKIYFEIGSTLNSIEQLQGFELCFEVQKDVQVENSVVLIDNVKLIRDK